MEEVERINIVMVCSTQRAELAQYNPYTINVDRRRKCYSYRGFGYLAWNCRRQIIGQGRRIEYEDNKKNKNNINGEGVTSSSP